MRSWIILSCFPLNPYDPPFIGFFFLSDRTPESSSSKGSDDNNGNERLILLPPMLQIEKWEGREREERTTRFSRTCNHTHLHTLVSHALTRIRKHNRGGGGGWRGWGSRQMVPRGGWRLFDHAIATRGGWCTRSRGGGRRRVMCSGRQPATNCGSWPPCSSATPEQGWLSALARRAPFTQTVKNVSVWLHPLTNTLRGYQFIFLISNNFLLLLLLFSVRIIILEKISSLVFLFIGIF